MPGPCSAPNGNYEITIKKRATNPMVRSGKTALKQGKIEHARLERFKKLTRKQREAQEES